MSPSCPSLTLTTDASKRGWGGSPAGSAHIRALVPESACHHINVLELWAVQLTLRCLTHLVQGQFVTIQLDNIIVVQYLNKQGRTRSPFLCQEIASVLVWCERRHIRLRGEDVPGADNLIVDALSRGGPQLAATKCA